MIENKVADLNINEMIDSVATIEAFNGNETLYYKSLDRARVMAVRMCTEGLV